MPIRSFLFIMLLSLAFKGNFAVSQEARYVIADQDASGPGGSDMTSLLVLLEAPGVKVLGITVVMGDDLRDIEVAHTLRLLETIGRTESVSIPRPDV